MEQVHRHRLASEANRDPSGLIQSAEVELRRLKPEADSGSERASSLSAVIQRMSGTSLVEIEKLITELQSLRDHLLNEGQRIQREISGYARLNQGAVESTRVITETLLKWKAGLDRRSQTQ
jgi:hypothetical protein